MQIYRVKKFWQFFSVKLILTSTLFLFVFQVYSQLHFHKYDTIPVYKSGSQLSMPWLGGLNSAQISTIDLNYDGLDDLVVFDRTDNKVLTFLNNGLQGTLAYEYAFEYEHKFPSIKGWMLLKDYNRDGKKDIFSKSLLVGAPRLHKNIGDMWSGVQFKEKREIVNSYYGNPSLPFDSSRYFNLYVSPADMPSIQDIDHDGDLDIITWGQSPWMRYYKNMAIENVGHYDTLAFQLKNECWGHAYEIANTTTHFLLRLFDTCANTYVYGPELASGSRHAGGTILTIDLNDDEIYDVIIGDAGYGNLVSANNGGAAVNTNSSLISQDTIFPSYNIPVDLKEMPAAFYEDVDNDSIKDLIVSPFEILNSENINSVWVYKNLGTNTSPSFSFVQNDFLQENTIDIGSSSMGTIFDYNKDGLPDMVVSSKGFFDRSISNYNSQLTLYKNIGTVNQPEFEFVTNNYQSLSSLNLGKDLYPHFEDINGDSKVDMILGNDSGKIHLFIDTSIGVVPAQFKLVNRNLLDNTSSVIDVGNQSKPQLFDFDGDHDLDLIIGEQSGVINYFENIGDSISYNFQFITDSMGRVEIYSPEDSGNTVITEGVTTPFFFREQGQLFMVSGSYYGDAYLYTNIDTLNPLSPFTLVDTIIKSKSIGKDLAVTVYDIDNSGKVDLLTGNRRGGVTWFYPGRSTVGVKEIVNEKTKVNIYPNPSRTYTFIEVFTKEDIDIQANLFDGTGKLIRNLQINSTKTKLNLHNLRKGIYYLQLKNNHYLNVKKIVVQ